MNHNSSNKIEFKDEIQICVYGKNEVNSFYLNADSFREHFSNMAIIEKDDNMHLRLEGEDRCFEFIKKIQNLEEYSCNEENTKRDLKYWLPTTYESRHPVRRALQVLLPLVGILLLLLPLFPIIVLPNVVLMLSVVACLGGYAASLKPLSHLEFSVSINDYKRVMEPQSASPASSNCVKKEPKKNNTQTNEGQLMRQVTGNLEKGTKKMNSSRDESTNPSKPGFSRQRRNTI